MFDTLTSVNHSLWNFKTKNHIFSCKYLFKLYIHYCFLIIEFLFMVKFKTLQYMMLIVYSIRINFFYRCSFFSSKYFLSFSSRMWEGLNKYKWLSAIFNAAFIYLLNIFIAFLTAWTLNYCYKFIYGDYFHEIFFLGVYILS